MDRIDEDVLLAEPRGFCAGVDRAIEIVERALAKFGAPIYVRHEIVHNTFVVNDLKAKGAIFIEDLAEVPPGATLVFSAHGVSQAVRREAAARGFSVFDATCPLVTQGARRGGQAGEGGLRVRHDRPQGPSRGRRHDGPADATASTWSRTWPTWPACSPRGDKLAVVTQTTLSVDDAAEILAAVKRRFPHVREPKKQDICYATQNRQDAVKLLSPQVDVVVVVGSPTSSNSNRLRELAERLGTPAYMVDSGRRPARRVVRRGRARVGLTAGASAPEVLVQRGDRAAARIRRDVACARCRASRRRCTSRCPKGLGDKSMRRGR